MGISREASTRNRDGNRIKKQRHLAAKSRKRAHQRQGEIEDKTLITKHIMKKRKSCPRTNITISKKKKQKLAKQIKYEAAFALEKKARDDLRGQTTTKKPKNSMEVDVEDKAKKVTKTDNKKTKKGKNSMEVDQ